MHPSSSPAASSTLLQAAKLNYVTNGKWQRPAGVFTHMSGDFSYLCAVNTAGRVWCRGPYGWEQLAWKLKAPVSKLVASTAHVCALLEDGGLSCAQKNGLPPGKYRDVTLSKAGACAIRTNGSIVCDWPNTLVKPPSGKFNELDCDAASSTRCCAIDQSGAGICWGDEAQQPPRKPLRQVGIVANAACALTERGDAHCWGRYAPRSQQGPFKQLYVGEVSACGTRADGHSICWPFTNGELAALPRVEVTAVALGYHSGCLLGGDGTPLCWDQRSFGPIPEGAFR